MISNSSNLFVCIPELRRSHLPPAFYKLPSCQVVLGHHLARPVVVKKAGRYCQRANCTRFAKSKGVCIAHGGGTRCIVEGCTKHAKANRRCISHGGRRCCSVDGCSKHARVKGKCMAHVRMTGQFFNLSTYSNIYQLGRAI